TSCRGDAHLCHLRPCEEGRDAAIHLPACGGMDCFGASLLAMTKLRHGIPPLTGPASSPSAPAPPACAGTPDTGSRSHPSASAGERIHPRTSSHPADCSRIPRRSRNRRGGGGLRFLSDLSSMGP